ncbi:porin [Parasphingorhabdus sp. JC815]|uniref:OprO/OprP family phosphate-selective porin n=1 Tax=Parasphingorhabdus sp. JC815 TaxID=3232140 RepID=UPI003457F46D
MKLKFVFATGAAIFALLPGQAFAAPLSEQEATALLERLNQMEQEIVKLRGQLDAVENEQQQSRKVAEVTKVDQSKKATSIKFKGAPEIKTADGWSFKPRGRILYDFNNLSSVPSTINIPGEGFSNEARRVRLGVQGSIPGGFGYKLEADLLDGVEITDAYLDYKTDGLTVKLGQHNNFQSLEELSSSNDGSFIERSAFTDAFGFQRQVGVSAAYQSGALLLQAGVFTDNIADLNDGNDSIGLDGRLVFSPKLGEAQLHLGGSLHWKDLGDNIGSLRYRQRPLIHSVDTRFINTGNMAADEQLTYGLEAAIIAGRFHASAESHWAKVIRSGLANPTFFGGSVEAGIFLSDDKREYKGGVFKGVKVSNPVGSGGSGAWQINVRYDRLDLTDKTIIGGTQDGFMASLIWTPVNYVRFLLNYGHLSYGNALGIVAGAPNDYSVDVVGARAQISF